MNNSVGLKIGFVCIVAIFVVVDLLALEIITFHWLGWGFMVTSCIVGILALLLSARPEAAKKKMKQKSWLRRHSDGLFAAGVVISIAVAVTVVIVSEVASTHWENGMIISVGYGTRENVPFPPAIVSIRLDENNTRNFYFYELEWKELRVSEHIRFRYQENRLIDFWYDDEEIEVWAK